MKKLLQYGVAFIVLLYPVAAFSCYSCETAEDCEKAELTSKPCLMPACRKFDVNGETVNKSCATCGAKDECIRKDEQLRCSYYCHINLCNRAATSAKPHDSWKVLSLIMLYHASGLR